MPIVLVVCHWLSTFSVREAFKAHRHHEKALTSKPFTKNLGSLVTTVSSKACTNRDRHH